MLTPRLQRTSAWPATWRTSWSAAAVGDDPATGQDQDAVGQLLGLVQVVGRQQDGRVVEVRQAVHQVVEVAPGMGSNPAVGLAGLLGEPDRLDQLVHISIIGPSYLADGAPPSP